MKIGFSLADGLEAAPASEEQPEDVEEEEDEAISSVSIIGSGEGGSIDPGDGGLAG